MGRSDVGPWLRHGSLARGIAVGVATLGLVVACVGTPPPPVPEDEGPEDSPGRLVLVAPDPTAFAAFGTDVVFEVEGVGFAADTSDFVYFRNDELVVAGTEVSGDVLTLGDALESGKNRLRVFARDADGLVLAAEATFWVGASSLEVSVVDAGGTPVADAEVTAVLADDPARHVVQAAPAGTTTILLPAATVVLTATGPGGAFGTATVLGSDGVATVVVTTIGAASDVDNNAFALGTAGWELDADDDGVEPVDLIAHVPGPLGPSAAAAALATHRGPRGAVAASGAPAVAIAPASDGTNVDLRLGTSGEGPQTLRRVFETEPDVRNVTVRFRFVTSEVPGGYFGSEYNDAYSVVVRSLFGGGLVVQESNSMNGLGLGAFDAVGATAWREVSLPVSPSGDVVEVDVSVSNVGDDELDSQVIVDLVAERPVAITEVALHDLTGDALRFLSVGPHTYFGGTTRVHGTITLEGPDSEALDDLVLEVLEGGEVVATGTLAASARDALLTEFGSDERIAVTASRLLFEIPAAGMSAIDTLENGDVVLRVRAETAGGAIVTRDAGAVAKLVRFDGAGRYGGRNATEGGDDWAKPGVKIAIDHFAATYTADGLLWGDFSNMNGGALSPHSTHDTGNDVDGFFTGYASRNAATAAKMIAYLNDSSYGSQIEMVLVTFSRSASDPFWNAIKDVVLDDGRLARDVIRSASNHDGHFHWLLADE